MNLYEFRARCSQCEDEMQIDELCWQWLNEAAKDNGKEGQIAQQLMKLIMRELMP